MGAGNTELADAAASIFTDLGYTVDDEGADLLARRKWRVVHVTPMGDPELPSSDGQYQCFVTWADRVPALERRLETAEPEYEWAIIGIDEDDYVVRRHPS